MTRVTKDMPLSITPRALEAATLHAISEKSLGREACGFIVGRGGVGERVIRLKNHHLEPARNYRMADTAVLAVFDEIDGTGEEVVSHYHSHPHDDPIPSPDDLKVDDHTHGYLIIGFDGDQPRAKAYRMDLQAIGVPRATEVLLHLSEDGQAYTPAPPKVSWALTEGNTVKVTYTRHGHVQRRTVIAVITRSTPTTIYIKPERPGRNIPQSLPVNRLLTVEVMKEAPLAQALRQRTVVQARRLAQMIAQGPSDDVAEVVQILAAAYPMRDNRAAVDPPVITPDATGILPRPVIIG